MTAVPRGRIFQGGPFSIEDLAGTAIAAIEAPAGSGPLTVVWVKVHECAWWHRAMIDEGLILWEEWDERGAFEDFEDVGRQTPTYAPRVLGKRIRSASCGGPEQPCIRLVTDAGTLVLDGSDPNSFVTRFER